MTRISYGRDIVLVSGEYNRNIVDLTKHDHVSRELDIDGLLRSQRFCKEKMVDLGGVDGMENAQVYKVDGFTLEENSQTLQMLHDYLDERGVQ